MRLLYWTEFYWPYVGGVELASAQLLADLQTRGYELCVVTSHGDLSLPDEDEHQGIPMHRFSFQPVVAHNDATALAASLRRVVALKRQFRPQLVHLNLTGSSAFFHLRTQSAHPARFLVSIRVPLTPLRGAFDQTLFGQVLRSADWFTANSAAMLEDLRAFGPEVAARSSLIYSRIHLPDVAPMPLPFDPPRLLCLGRLVGVKGFDLALDAFARLTGQFPAARLVVAGDGAARAALERQAAELDLTDRVEFTGWVEPDQVPALINTATLLIVPSRWREAFPQVALQAAHLARPVVAARVGGLPEAVVDGETGLLFEREDSQGLAEAVRYLLEHPAEAEALGRAGRARTGRLFGWASYVDAYDALYRQLVGHD